MECCICYGKDNLIKYNHCIPVNVHQKCIEEWNRDLNNCFVCRNTIIQMSSPEVQVETRIQTYNDTDESVSGTCSCCGVIKKLFKIS